ncbi:unnamed protein product [Gongylonema pulchrum]|uniref:Peroxisomal membrane protein PMP34 n=1 Tax=Gongylonema pulchrum TaxID=637853 RepID=A0A183D022_9BILA|nr:unnamed protein product [Gongylonema pulchrum]
MLTREQLYPAYNAFVVGALKNGLKLKYSNFLRNVYHYQSASGARDHLLQQNVLLNLFPSLLAALVHQSVYHRKFLEWLHG